MINFKADSDTKDNHKKMPKNGLKNIREGKNFHKFLSGTVFLLCLIFDAFYTGNTYDVQHSINLLLYGWIGILDGYFSWIANPLYIFALFRKKGKTIILLSALSLLFALSFLTKEKLLVSEAPSYDIINAYGPGYFLWILSIALLLVGEALKNLTESSRNKKLALLLFIILSASFYGIYYFSSDKSAYHIYSQREKQFNYLCSRVKEKIYKPMINVKGLYIDNIPGDYFETVVGQTHGSYGSRLISFVKSGYYNFEERNSYNSRETKLPYVRIYADKPNERIPIEKLEANYAVRAENIAADLPKSLGIRSYRVYIVSLETNEIFAETTFVRIINEHKICAPTSIGSYSISNFVLKALTFKNNI